MLHADFIRGVKILADQGYSYDILVTENQLPNVLKLVTQLPVMNLVIDHIAKPVIASSTKPFSPISPSSVWQDCMTELASHGRIYCKLSGMITEANWSHWQAEDIYPYMNHVYQHFGAERLMFGSAWPVCGVAGSYEDVVELVEGFIRRFMSNKVQSDTEPTVASVMGGNAQRFYQL